MGENRIGMLLRMKAFSFRGRVLLAALALCGAFLWGVSAFAQSVPPPGFTAGQVPSPQQWQNAWASKQDFPGGAGGPVPDGIITGGRLKVALQGLNTSIHYSAGACAYSAGAYSCAAGAQPLPATLVAGQVYFVNFNAANLGAATLKVGSLSAKPLKVYASSGAVLTLAGGEIVSGWGTAYYDGTEFIYAGAAGASAVKTSTATTLSQANFANGDLFYLTAAETFTLPCSAAISPNGRVLVMAVSGAATINVGGSCSGDTITKNGSSGSSTTVAEGAALAVIVTDGAGHFYVSGS
jgi:hypothetical protein